MVLPFVERAKFFFALICYTDNNEDVKLKADYVRYSLIFKENGVSIKIPMVSFLIPAIAKIQRICCYLRMSALTEHQFNSK